jgi:transcription initiation factor TFIIF subunit alpha
MTGALVPAPVAVHFKFGGEVAHATVSVPPPATPEAVCAAILEARKDVAAMLKDAYAGFELAVCDAAGGRPLEPDAAPLAPDAKVEVVLTKAYAVRAFAPVRKYVVGRFLGTKPPKFKAGRAAAVDWQMTRGEPELAGAHGALRLVAGGKQKAMFSGAREAGALGNFYLLMMQANTTDVCAIPTEGWYNFRPDAPRRVLTLEEAEEALERRAHNQTATTAFMERMKREGAANADLALANDALSDSEENDPRRADYDDDDDDAYDDDPVEAARRRRAKAARAAVKREDRLDAAAMGGDAVDEAAPGARGMTKAEGDDWEHDGGASDDEGAGEADELELEEPPPPPPPAGMAFGDSDDEGADGEGNALDETGKNVRRLLGKQEDEEGGGISDDSDDDDEFVDPDQEELHPFLLQRRDKMQAMQAATASEPSPSDAATQRATPMAQQGAQTAGVKRSRSDEDVAAGARVSPAARVAKSARGAGAGPSAPAKAEPASVAAAVSGARPIEAALRELLRKGGKVTTKDVTKHLRKKGLLSSEDDKKELKETMSSIARIRKEGNVAYVVLQ